MSTETNIFEKGTRLGLRFASTKGGEFTIEQLWKLPLKSVGSDVSLNTIAVALDNKIRATERSFVDEGEKDDTDVILHLSFDVVMHIINVKIEEKKARIKEAELAAELEEKKEVLQEALKTARYKELTKGKLAAELQAELDKLA